MAYLLCISFLSPTFSLIQNYPHSPLENRNFNSKNLFIPPKSLIKSLPSTPQRIKLESKTPSANGKTRISSHTFSWQSPEKTPQRPLFPADLLDFHPLNHYFVWKIPYADVYLHIYTC